MGHGAYQSLIAGFVLHKMDLLKLLYWQLARCGESSTWAQHAPSGLQPDPVRGMTVDYLWTWTWLAKRSCIESVFSYSIKLPDHPPTSLYLILLNTSVRMQIKGQENIPSSRPSLLYIRPPEIWRDRRLTRSAPWSTVKYVQLGAPATAPDTV